MPKKTVEELQETNNAASAEDEALAHTVLENLPANPGDGGDTPIIPNSSEKAIRLPLQALFPGSSKAPDQKFETTTDKALPVEPVQEQATLDALQGIDRSQPAPIAPAVIPKAKKVIPVSLPKMELEKVVLKANELDPHEFLIIKINKQALLILIALILILIAVRKFYSP